MGGFARRGVMCDVEIWCWFGCACVEYLFVFVEYDKNDFLVFEFSNESIKMSFSNDHSICVLCMCVTLLTELTDLRI